MINENIKQAKQQYPNQKVIIVDNQAPCDEEHLYSKTNIQSERHACLTLKSQYGFALWRYITINQPGYVFGLSKKDFCENWAGCSKKGYDAAVKDLIANHFLIPDKDDPDVFIFRNYGSLIITVDNPKKKKPIQNNEGFKF